MNTEALGRGRILVVAGFALTCFGLMLFLWNAFGGPVPLKPMGYRVTVALPEADLLAEQADVRISGVSVGRVIRTEETPGNRKDAILEIEARYAPLGRDVRATIRRKSLAGEEYLELTPGGPRTPAVADGGRLAGANVAPSVEIDEVLRAFDEPTRRHFATWIQSQAMAMQGRGDDLNAAIGTLPAFAEELTGFLKTLNGQQAAVRAAVANTGVLFEAISARRDALDGAITQGERATRALAGGSEGIAQTFRALPAFERESTLLLRRAERFRRRADPVIGQLRPGVRAFGDAMRDVPATASEVKGLVAGVDDLSAAARRGLPAATAMLDAMRPLVAQFDPFLDQLAPVLGYIAPRAGALNTLVANVTAATNATTAGYGSAGAGVHYARGGMQLNPTTLAQYPAPQSWSRVNPYAEAGLRAGRPLGAFDASTCTDDLKFPRLSGPAPAGSFTPQMLAQIDHFVLNDGKAAAPPCALTPRPRGFATTFPHVSPLSHEPGATTP